MIFGRAVGSLKFAAIAATLLLGGGSALAHDDGTPPSAEGPITDTVLASGLPNAVPGMVLQLEEFTIDVGAAIPTHTHPGAYVIYVKQGQFGFTVVEGEAQLTRKGSTTAEAIPAGQEVIAQPGDSLFENGGVVHSARNAGSDLVIVDTAALLMDGMPSLQPTNDEGTPVS